MHGPVMYVILFDLKYSDIFFILGFLNTLVHLETFKIFYISIHTFLYPYC